MGAKEIFKQLQSYGLTIDGTCALLGNMEAESGLKSNIAQRGMTDLSDEEYTRLADSGHINFVNDSVGYGLCQWTYNTRKRALLDFARYFSVSVGDESMQVSFCISELRGGYRSLFDYLCSTKDLRTATERICKEYERPAINNIQARYGFAQHFLALAQSDHWENDVEKKEATEDEPEIFWPPRMLDYKEGRENLKGPDVLVLQSILVSRGYDCPTSGDFDARTRIRVMEFQAEHGLVGDGVSGNDTWTQLLSRRK